MAGVMEADGAAMEATAVAVTMTEMTRPLTTTI